MKQKKIISAFIMFIIISIMTYGFVKPKPLIFFTSNDQNTEILGVWIMEEEPNIKIEFTMNGEMKTYVDNVIESTDLYNIVDTCNGDTNSSGESFLKITDLEDGSIYCNIINGINENGSNILSMTSENGKLLVYIR